MNFQTLHLFLDRVLSDVSRVGTTTMVRSSFGTPLAQFQARQRARAEQVRDRAIDQAMARSEAGIAARTPSKNQAGMPDIPAPAHG